MAKLNNIKNSLIADLHIHSKYSRACSNKISLSNLEEYARMKGVDLLGTGDFTHPKWFKALDKLEEREGILYSEEGFPFVWQTEISLIYTQEKGRRIHLVILAPSKEIVKNIITYLSSKGRLDYDGRPIFGISCIELVEDLKKIDKRIEIIPAHIWTPWFSLFGSKSGFNSIKEAFGDQANEINAIETGLSSDPKMNWRISELNNKTIISSSDMHSFWPWRMGREATIYSIDKESLSYEKIIDSIRKNKIVGTIEVNPAYGKYHYDGHRKCNFSCSPVESKKIKNICPKCGNRLTIGVENRVEELADQNPEDAEGKKDFFELLPLHEIISLVKGVSISTKTVWREYRSILNKFRNEFEILLKASKQDLSIIDNKLASLILKNRSGKIEVKPGFDGRYGEAMIEEKQKKLL